jgi:peroxin-6
MDRNYQPLFLHALKSHFAGIRRLVKQGDLIAIGIDAGLIHQIREIDSKLDGMVDTTDFNVFEIS